MRSIAMRATLMIAVLLIAGCGDRSTTTSTPTPVPTPAPTPSPVPVDVYVAGYEYNSRCQKVAKVWKNGIATALTDGVQSAEALSVAVSGSDVYVAGSDGRGATLWKNGVAMALTDRSRPSSAESVVVSEGDVYVTGGECDGQYRPPEEYTTTYYCVAKIWKNGVPAALTDGTRDAGASSVAVSGSDVYAAGWEMKEQGWPSIAKVWKNGVATTLSDGANIAYARSVAVSGNDVYVAGKAYSGGYAANVWKNGVVTHLPTLDGMVWQGNDAFSVAVSGDDVYVAGSQSRVFSNWSGGVDVATIWKNGVAMTLTDGTGSSSHYAGAFSVAVSGGDVYVAGFDNNVAKVWKNGVATALTNGTQIAQANCVFLGSH